MPLTLHAATVPGWLQILHSVEGLLIKAGGSCEEMGIPEDQLLQARLADDMLPFAYQVKSCWTHSAHALDGVRNGSFSPHMNPPPDSLSGLRDLIAAAIEGVSAADEAELERIAGKDMVFTIGDKLRLEFTVQDFLLGFSKPNFLFHAATAYDLMRHLGMDIGKRDFLGQLPIKGA